ncbi:MAG: SURF1 family protein [Sphingomonadaceae bacterium]|nr:SURF1 family protein [Sphingomonadaceae bacterium]
MRRLPLVPTLIVLLAVPTMIALGFWQLSRAEWKEALLARLAANASAPTIDAPAALAPRKDELSFRRVRVVCAGVVDLDPTAARSVAGVTGYRQLVRCERAEGEPLLVSLGVATDPAASVSVAPGATFTGRLVPRGSAPVFLLVSDTPVGALAAEAPPGPDTISNSHRGYAVQWFLFALVLSVIYGVYVRRRAGAVMPRR